MTHKLLKFRLFLPNILREVSDFQHLTENDDQCLQKTNANRKMRVNSIPAYLIHWSTRFRLSISLKTELDIPTVFRMSNAFLCALCVTDISPNEKVYHNGLIMLH